MIKREFTIENSMKALEQFKTKEELAGLFLEMTTTILNLGNENYEKSLEIARLEKLLKEVI